MGFESWHNYGYGICVSEIKDVPLERLEHLLQCAPVFLAEVQQWMQQHGIEKPSYEDYLEFDQDFMLGLATLLSEVIEETEHIRFTACNDYEGNEYLIYMPSYPWELPDNERQLTEKNIDAVLSKYIVLLTDEAITIGYQSVENGG